MGGYLNTGYIGSTLANALTIPRAMFVGLGLWIGAVSPVFPALGFNGVFNTPTTSLYDNYALVVIFVVVFFFKKKKNYCVVELYYIISILVIAVHFFFFCG